MNHNYNQNLWYNFNNRIEFSIIFLDVQYSVLLYYGFAHILVKSRDEFLGTILSNLMSLGTL